jgi:hypothetical protein
MNNPTVAVAVEMSRDVVGPPGGMQRACPLTSPSLPPGSNLSGCVKLRRPTFLASILLAEVRHVPRPIHSLVRAH